MWLQRTLAAFLGERQIVFSLFSKKFLGTEFYKKMLTEGTVFFPSFFFLIFQ